MTVAVNENVRLVVKTRIVKLYGCITELYIKCPFIKLDISFQILPHSLFFPLNKKIFVFQIYANKKLT